MNFLFFFFINTLRPRSAAARSEWPSNGGSVVGKAPIIDPEISPRDALKFRIYFDHVTLDILRTFKVNGSKVKVTAWHNVSASKITIIQARICCRRSNLVKIISEPSATRYVTFKVSRSNTEIAITPPWTARLRSNLVQSFITSHVQGQRSKVKSSQVQQLQTWHDIVIKAEKYWCGSGVLKLQCIRNCHVF